MRTLQRFRLRLRSLFGRARVERELADELSFHLEQQIAENRAAGMPAAEARLAAMRLLGGVPQIQAECRDMRMTTAIESVFQDLRYALRVEPQLRGYGRVCGTGLRAHRRGRGDAAAGRCRLGELLRCAGRPAGAWQ